MTGRSFPDWKKREARFLLCKRFPSLFYSAFFHGVGGGGS
jgi:hypothetical protein